MHFGSGSRGSRQKEALVIGRDKSVCWQRLGPVQVMCELVTRSKDETHPKVSSGEKKTAPDRVSEACWDEGVAGIW